MSGTNFQCDKILLLIDTAFILKHGLSIPGWPDTDKLLAWLNGGNMTAQMGSFLKSAGCPMAADGTVTRAVPDDMPDKLKQAFWSRYPLCDSEGHVIDPGDP